jgi:hypothetical protein
MVPMDSMNILYTFLSYLGQARYSVLRTLLIRAESANNSGRAQEVVVKRRLNVDT